MYGNALNGEPNTCVYRESDGFCPKVQMACPDVIRFDRDGNINLMCDGALCQPKEEGKS